MHTLRCTFLAQEWVGDTAYPVLRDNPPTWMCQVESIPDPFSPQSDDLRFMGNCPEWARDWDGPFEVDFEVVPPEELLVKTTITVTVLSRGCVDFETLEDVNFAISGGDCSGIWDVTSTEYLTKEQMAEELQAQRSDPEFLGCGDEGPEDN